jgi:hypothetical protein
MQLHKPHYSSSALLALLVAGSILASGCTALRPQVSLPAEEQAPIYVPPTLVPYNAGTATPDATNPLDAQVPGCTSQLSVVNDLTIPDGTYISPGASLDKQWDVKNSGTCNWNETYSIRLVSGPDLGATSPQAITPLRAGVEGTLRVIFIAPQKPGNYLSTWQAYDANGQAFGDQFWIEINVSPK